MFLSSSFLATAITLSQLVERISRSPEAGTVKPSDAMISAANARSFAFLGFAVSRAGCSKMVSATARPKMQSKMRERMVMANSNAVADGKAFCCFCLYRLFRQSLIRCHLNAVQNYRRISHECHCGMMTSVESCLTSPEELKIV